MIFFHETRHALFHFNILHCIFGIVKGYFDNFSKILHFFSVKVYLERYLPSDILVAIQGKILRFPRTRSFTLKTKDGTRN